MKHVTPGKQTEDIIGGVRVSIEDRENLISTFPQATIDLINSTIYIERDDLLSMRVITTTTQKMITHNVHLQKWNNSMRYLRKIKNLYDIII